MRTKIKTILSGGLVLGVLLWSTQVLLAAPVQPFAGNTYNLAGSGISSSATSITLTSLTIKQTGQPIQDSDLSSTFYFTIEPGSPTKQEIVSCTTVGTNTGGSVVLSGCTRGLSPIPPYTASTTLAYSHAGGTQVIFSDAPQLFNQYAAKSNDETITGQWTFNNFPITPSNSPCTESVAGVCQLATGAQAAATTLSGSVGRLSLSTAISSSTWNSNTAGNIVPVTGLSSKVIDSQFVLGATAKLPTTVGASSTVLTPDGSGNFTYQPLGGLINFASSTPIANVTTASTTFYQAAIPANYLGKNDMIKITTYFSKVTNSNDFYTIAFSYGSATTTAQVFTGLNANNPAGYITFILKANGATNSQRAAIVGNMSTSSAVGTVLGTFSTDSTTANQITGVMRTGAGDDIFTSFSTTEILRQ